MENDATQRGCFTFYRSYFDAIEIIPDPTQRAALYAAIARFMLDGEFPDLTESDPLTKMAWQLILPTLQRAIVRAENSRKNGRKGGAPVGNTNAKKQPKTTQKQPGTTQKQPGTSPYTGTSTDTDTKTGTNTSTRRFKSMGQKVEFSPTLSEVMAEANVIGANEETAKRFYSHYEAKGWQDNNGQPLRNWSAMLQAWAKHDRECAEEEVIRISLGLGVGEYIDPKSKRRTYGSGKATIPEEAPPRPSERHQWDSATKNWILL